MKTIASNKISLTLKNWNWDYAWDHRAETDIIEIGNNVTVDNESTYEVIGINRNNEDGYQSYFFLKPIGDTLKRYQNEHDESCRHNYREEQIGVYPDFIFNVESLWFFSRNVIVNQ